MYVLNIVDGSITSHPKMTYQLLLSLNKPSFQQGVELNDFNFLHSQVCVFDKFVLQGRYAYCDNEQTLNELYNLILLMGGKFNLWDIFPSNESVTITKDCIRLLAAMK